MENFTTGGEVSLNALRERQAFSTKLLIGLYGEELGQIALTDRSLLKLVLPVLDSDGKDMQAVEVLCKALKA